MTNYTIVKRYKFDELDTNLFLKETIDWLIENGFEIVKIAFDRPTATIKAANKNLETVILSFTKNLGRGFSLEIKFDTTNLSRIEEIEKRLDQLYGGG